MERTQTLCFLSDKHQLVGTLHLPLSHKPPVIIGCHGLFADRNSPKQIALAQACTDKGFAYLRFDHRGCGESQGDFNKVTSLPARCTDLYHAVQTMQQHPLTGEPVGLFGSSFGGAVILYYSARFRIAKLVTFAAPYASRAINAHALRTSPPGAILSDALQTALTFDLLEDLPQIANILVIHGAKDELVPMENATLIHDRAKSPKKLIIQENGDHCMSDRLHQKQFIAQAMSWFLR